MTRSKSGPPGNSSGGISGAIAGDLEPCGTCGRSVAPRALFCHACGAAQPPRPLDSFTRLGLERRFDIDLEQLSKQHAGFTRAMDPERFAARGPRQQANAKAQAEALRDAYEVLRDPIRRAHALLGLIGGMPADGVSGVASLASDTSDLRKTLIGLAMKLRDIRYVRGGRDPSTGFDCSGFVRYVFAHAVGLELPTNSASQFLAGLKVNRADMKPGDLVFFHTHGKSRISHVGIYISDGRFIHSPASGKSVEISSLNEAYWAKRFAGAKRPEGIAQVASKG